MKRKINGVNGIDVIKIGGTLLEGNAFAKLARALAAFIKKNPTILVHGGGKAVSALSERLGIPTKFVNGRRVTDAPTMEIAEMVLSGKINPYVSAQLRQCGVAALGLSGHHSGLLRARSIKELGRVGEMDRIDRKKIQQLLTIGYTPVLASIAEDKNGDALNVNADDMASSLAIAQKARRLILFTDVPGILDAQKKTIASITPDQGKKLIADAVITGGMIPKVQSAFEALNRGVKEIWILHGQLPLTNARGTVITENPKKARHPFKI